MTSDQKNSIAVLRSKNKGYSVIAKQLGISKETVKTYCRRNNITGVRVGLKDKPGICPHCGKQVLSVPGHKPRRFCSDECRRLWWNTHLNQINRKALYQFTCRNCGSAFSAYGNSKRKYCSHECYILARYKGGDAK